MEPAVLSSPERNGSILPKSTYLGRQKRKHALSKAEPDSDSEDSSTSEASSPPMKTNRTPKTTVTPKTPVSKGPKKVDVDLPGPSPPKRVRRDSNESVEEPKKIKATHARRPSAGSSKQVTQQQADSPPVSKKSEPNSIPVKKPRSKAKSIIADDDNDDNVSVADSSISVTRIRRNEAERIEYFKNQSECSHVEPHSAHCNVCDKSVNLGRKQTYAVRPWEIHRARCDKRAAKSAPDSPVLNSTFLLEAERREFSPEAKPISKPTPARRPNENDRKDFLEGDHQIKTLEKDRALCSRCDKWVSLSDVHSYATGNWMKHKKECSNVVPSSRVAAAKRKLLLVNDNQVKSFSPKTTECAFCGVSVQLNGEGDFNLTNWDAHKVHCDKNNPVAKSDIVNSVPFPTPSSASTEDTLVVEGGFSKITQGVKRLREEPHSLLQEDERPSARPRTASYLPPQIEPPNSVLGWFMLPFHSFVRGFKESLKDRS